VSLMNYFTTRLGLLRDGEQLVCVDSLIVIEYRLNNLRV
jgi:hypothetical protein